MKNLREILFWKFTDIWYNNIPVSLRVRFDQFLFEYIQYSFGSGGVISKNDLEGQKSNNVQEVQT